ncbi:glycoside hydrolase [Clavibacter michiganensis]|nr:glycoside hydrolase [Clavibacter michiganensis]
MTLTLDQIRIRDPFILPDAETRTYHLFGTTDRNVWGGSAVGFDSYSSTDLETWEGPYPAFRPSDGFWGTTQFWAPEVYKWQSRFVMFATFSDGTSRATAALIASSPLGPFVPWSFGPLTPSGWMCLDGTLFITDEGNPWIVFCREWLEIQDGEIYAQRLADDLRSTVDEPIRLFTASQAGWSHSPDPTAADSFVTDGPWLFEDGGRLRMLWSTHSVNGYAIALSESESGRIEGPWWVFPQPVQDRDGGHAMLFRTFDGHRKLVLHHPNDEPDERAQFVDFPDLTTTLPLLIGH